jgi:hypothetical protein
MFRRLFIGLLENVRVWKHIPVFTIVLLAIHWSLCKYDSKGDLEEVYGIFGLVSQQY